MEIIFHSHHAAISPRLQQRAEQSLRKLVGRMGRAVGAVIRFEEDGPTRRVEVLLLAPRGRRLVARGEGRNFGPALTAALDRLSTRVDRVRTRRAVARKGGGVGGVAAKRASRRKLARA